MGGLNQRRVCLLLTQITNVKLQREGREGKRDEKEREGETQIATAEMTGTMQQTFHSCRKDQSRCGVAFHIPFFLSLPLIFLSSLLLFSILSSIDHRLGLRALPRRGN